MTIAAATMELPVLRLVPREPTACPTLNQFMPWPAVTVPIRQSSINTAAECLRKFALRHLYGLRRRGSHSDALWCGTVFHVWLYHRYTGRSDDAANSDVLARIEYDVQQVAERRPMDAADLRRSLEREAMLGRALADIHWKHHPIRCDDKFRMLEAEQRLLFAIEPWASAVASVKPDLVLEDARGGDLWLVDFKTEGGSPLGYVQSAEWRAQAVLYGLGLSAKYPDRYVRGIVHVVVKKPTIRLSQTDVKAAAETGTTPYQAYLSRVRDWFAERAAKNPDDPPTLQAWTPFRGPLWTDETRAWFAAQVRLHSSRNTAMAAYPKDPSGSACRGRFFQSPCEFLPLCRLDPALWAGIIDRLYDRMDPFAEYPQLAHQP